MFAQDGSVLSSLADDLFTIYYNSLYLSHNPKENLIQEFTDHLDIPGVFWKSIDNC